MRIIALLFLLVVPAWAHEPYFFSVELGGRYLCAPFADARWVCHSRPGQSSLLIYDGSAQVTLVYPGEGRFSLGQGATVRLKTAGRVRSGSMTIQDDGDHFSADISGTAETGEAVHCQIWISKSDRP